MKRYAVFYRDVASNKLSLSYRGSPASVAVLACSKFEEGCVEVKIVQFDSYFTEEGEIASVSDG